MFRPMRPCRAPLSEGQCKEILNRQLRGVLSLLGDDGYPYGVPINHWFNEADGCLYFHSGPVGHKLDAMALCRKASYCVCSDPWKEEGDWAWNVRSVIVFGKLERIEDQSRAIEITRQLSYRFTADTAFIEEEIRKSGAAVRVFRLVPEQITGIQES